MLKRASFDNRRVVISLVSLFVIGLLFLAGPVEAFVLGLNVDNANPHKGDVITFDASVEIEGVDRYLPVGNLTLTLTGPSPLINSRTCVFGVDGNILEGCEGMNISALSDFSCSEYGYGYGYGYGYSYGYGYNFGYGYGYNCGVLRYEVTLDTGSYDVGEYSTFLMADIGDLSFSKEGALINILASGSGDGGSGFGVSSSSSKGTGGGWTNPDCGSGFHVEYKNGLGSCVADAPLDLDGSSDVDLGSDEVGGDENRSFWSRITGAVIGGGAGSVVAAILFVLVILGLFWFVWGRK